jgi:hypothetical protein
LSAVGRLGIQVCPIAGAVLLLCGAASASPSFPAELERALDLACAPVCTTCHSLPEGGFGTARTPFALAMQDAGLEARRTERIAPALEELRALESDVDGDGAQDIDELVALDDPNSAGTPLKCTPADGVESGGCALGSRGSAAPGRGWWFAVLLGLALASGRRRSDGR